MIEVKQVGYRIGKSEILKDIRLSLLPGHFYAINGPNGSGKSTLLRLLAGLTFGSEGSITFDRIDLRDWQEKDLAQQRAFLQQNLHLNLPYQVREVVKMGRYPYRNACSPEENEAILVEAVHIAGIGDLLERSCLDLSGGEWQRVQLARILAQVLDGNGVKGKVLLVDEPLNHLDIQHQHVLLQKLQDLAKAGALVVAVLHDLNLSLQYCHRSVLLWQGRVLDQGPTPEVLNSENIEKAFQVRSTLLSLDSGRLYRSFGPQPQKTLIYE